MANIAKAHVGMGTEGVSLSGAHGRSKGGITLNALSFWAATIYVLAYIIYLSYPCGT